MILITGSTGLVGRHLLLALILKGDKVRALYRSENKKNEVLHFLAFAKADSHEHLIEWILGDITEIPSLSVVFKDVTHVYHCAALISFDPYEFKRLTKINVEGTANVVNLCLSNNVDKLIHLSSIATLAKLPNSPITEENYWDPDAKNSVYGLTKNGAEMEVWRGTEEGLDAIIFNPGIILGEGSYTDGSGSLFQHVIKEKSYYPRGGSAVIDVKDLVELMIRAMASTITQERYLTIAHNVSYQELFEKIAQKLNKKPQKISLSNTLLMLINGLDFIRGLITRKRAITKIGYQTLQTITVYSNNKISEDFNYTFKSLESTLARIASHIKENH